MKINSYIERISKKYLASNKLWQQIIGAMFKRWWILLIVLFPIAFAFKPLFSFLLTPFSLLWNVLADWMSSHFIPVAEGILRTCFNNTLDIHITGEIINSSWYHFILLSVIVCLAILVCNTLTDIFILKKKEAGITWCQISILLALGSWIVGTIIIFNIQKETRFAAVVGIGGSLLTWIFQDTIKGVVAFIHLRLNHLLQIGDWIQIPKYNVDGMVKRVTLTMVTLYNWDTTTSSIPTSVLHSDHFINLQNMMDGKTYGRRMYMRFILDTNWIHKMSQEDISKLKVKTEILKFLPESEITTEKTNAQLFRYYLYHWLMRHQHVSQQPRLIIRWQEQLESGMPLQVYAFITDSHLQDFEWQQSQIVEHIMAALEDFELSLYQSPSAYDVSNSNIHLTDKPATYRKEELP